MKHIAGENSNHWRIFVLILIILLYLVSPALGADNVYNSDPTAGVGYYMGNYVSDTIPHVLEAGSVYPVTITYRNNGMVSWEWGVEKFGLMYQGLQSSIEVVPVFSQIPSGIKVETQNEYQFPFTLTPPDKPGEYELSFSMSTRKGENRYTPFPNSYTKKITIIPKEGVSSGSVGSIIIDSDPSDATVLMGSEEKGKTPLILPDLNPAKYIITINHPGFPSQWTEVQVQQGSVSRVFVDLSRDEKPSVTIEHLQKYTLLGWFLDNLLLILITIVVLFLGFQVLMMNTNRVPEHHPIRRIARPFILVSPSHDGKVKFRRTSKEQGKSGKSGDIISDSGQGKASGNNKSTGASAAGSGKGKTARDKKLPHEDGSGTKKKIETFENESTIDVEDPDQEGKEMEGMWGFPHSLRDRYEPLGVAGSDSYARVYKVRKKDSGAVRALKVGNLKQEESEILQKETAVWRSLRHPNIVHLFRSEFLDDISYLENEYLGGVSYKGMVHTSLSGLPKPVRDKYAVSLVRDIADGLKYAHDIGVRHYHLQTGDILLTPQLRAKISGFARGRNELGFSINDSDVHDADAAYITPEQKNSEKYGNPGRKTDIYQVGVIFYELLTGYMPYSPEAFRASGRNGTFEEYPDELILPSEIRKNLKKYDAIIQKMLSRKKTGRYFMLSELLSDLENLPGE
ncbi:MAG: protein kinase [Methanomicrobiales archaeon]|nr:protein kinase [Methanomicrobiales archaeon]